MGGSTGPWHEVPAGTTAPAAGVAQGTGRAEATHLASDERDTSRTAALRRLLRRRPPWLRLPPRMALTLAVLGTAALAAYLSDAAPTEIRALDEAYVAGLTATVAFFATSARRWTWFVPAGVGAAVAVDSRMMLLLAAAALGLGLWVVAAGRRTPARAALVAGVGVAVLMRAESVGFRGTTALLTAAAVLPIVVSGYRLASRPVRRYTGQAMLVAGGLMSLMVIGAVIGGASVAQDLVDGTRLLDEGVVAARDADDQVAANRLTQASRHLQSASSTLESWFVQPARALPVVGPNLEAVSRLADDTGDVAQASSDAATSVDVDALRFSDGRLDPALVGTVADSLGPVATTLERAQASLDDVRSPWLLPAVSQRMDRLEREVRRNGPDVTNAVRGAQAAQFLLAGTPERPMRYLVLFTTPTEARGRTGFPGNYAELEVIDGRITMPRFGRISELEQAGTPGPQRFVTGPADYLARYDRFDPLGTWRNLTMSPDFPSIAQVAMELYPQSSGTELAGVMSIDPTGLAALMHFTGPIQPAEVEGLTTPLTEQNVAQYLHLDQYRTFAGANDDRIDFLGDVAEITFRRLTTGVDLPGPEEVVDVLSPAVKGGHIQFVSPLGLDYFDSIGMAGRFDPARCDFLSVVNNNAGGNKLDQFLERSLRYDVNWDPATSAVSSHVTATLRNAVSPADLAALPDYVVGNVVGLPRGTNRSFVSIYSCGLLSLEGARLNGQPLAVQSEVEVGRDVYSTFVDIPPGGTVILELDLRGALGEPSYDLTLAQQPLVRAERAEIAVTVGGDDRVRARGEDVVVDDRTVRWAGPLDRERSFVVRAGEED
jgi:hypothetical protein